MTKKHAFFSALFTLSFIATNLYCSDQPILPGSESGLFSSEYKSAGMLDSVAYYKNKGVALDNAILFHNLDLEIKNKDVFMFFRILDALDDDTIIAYLQNTKDENRFAYKPFLKSFIARVKKVNKKDPRIKKAERLATFMNKSKINPPKKPYYR